MAPLRVLAADELGFVRCEFLKKERKTHALRRLDDDPSPLLHLSHTLSLSLSLFRPLSSQLSKPKTSLT